MRIINLTKGKITLVDDEDYESIMNEGSWYTVQYDRYFYAQRNTGKRPNRKLLYLHNFIMQPPPGFLVDHINHDGLDNQKHNLRIVTPSQNQMNRRIHSNNKSGYKGIYQNKNTHKWSAEIQVDGKRISKYGFIYPEDAARAYDELAREYHGEFAVLNFK